MIKVDKETAEEYQENIEKIKWQLWHGNTIKAMSYMDELGDADDIENDYAHLDSFVKHLKDFVTYITNNEHYITNTNNSRYNGTNAHKPKEQLYSSGKFIKALHLFQGIKGIDGADIIGCNGMHLFQIGFQFMGEVF